MTVPETLAAAHKIALSNNFRLSDLVAQRRASRPALAEIAREFRRAADLVDEATSLLTPPRESHK